MKLQDFHYFIHQKEGNPNSKAPWLVLIHGLLGSAGNWRRITPAFENDYRVLTYDQRGHGRSVKPDHGYAPSDYASDLLLIMDSLKIETANILGHSMGGRTALEFTSKNPKRVTKLIIEDIGPEGTDEFGSDLIDTLRSIPVPFESKLKAKEYLLNELSDARLGSFFYTNIEVKKDGSVNWVFNIDKIIETIIEGRRVAPWSEVGALKCPTLLIRGENSGALTLEGYKKVLEANRLIQGVEIKDSGHWVHIDQAAKFIEVVKEFLRGV